MKGIIRRLRPSPAMVVACIALVFAMTGAGYAAGMLGPNTVGTKQLKKNAVISSKVKNRSLLAADFKAGQLPRGAQGPQGPQGAQGAQGIQGIQGPPGPFPDPLGPGQTVRGSFAVTEAGAAAGNYMIDGISFGFRMSAAPTARYILAGAPPPAECPGTITNPQAAPGNLCVYESGRGNVSSAGICNTETNGCTIGLTNREGAAVYAFATAAGQAYEMGTWAATAPSASFPSSETRKSLGTVIK
jgi:hypothetical protein